MSLFVTDKMTLEALEALKAKGFVAKSSWNCDRGEWMAITVTVPTREIPMGLDEALEQLGLRRCSQSISKRKKDYGIKFLLTYNR